MLARRTVAALLLALAAPSAHAVTTLETRIAASSDDAEEHGTASTVDLASGDIELVRDNGAPQVVGLRFPGMAIPAGATILAAYMQFETDEVQSGPVSLTIQGDQSEDAPALLPTPGDLSARPRTTASVGWVPVPWLVIGQQGPDQRTPSLVGVVQELVNAPHWMSGDAVSLIVTGTGSGRRTARAWDSVPTGAALLHVEFDPPANQRPVLGVASPLQGTTALAGTSLAFTATATDPESGDVSGSISWTSSLDGVLGVGASFSRSDLSVGVHSLTLSASDGSGGITSRTRRLTIFGPSNQLVAAGDIGTCTGTADEATGALLETLGGTIFGLGDFAYNTSSTSDFANCFDPAWGRHKSRIRPILGNEYQQPGAGPYFAYFGAAAGNPSQGWYSFDVAGWHVVALNSQCTKIGGCDVGSPQGQWLEADLAAHSKPCTLAAFHDPRFSSGQAGVDNSTLGLWQILYAHGVDVLLHGDDHAYERFARMNPNGGAEPLRGVRSFIVGTGGVGLHGVDEVEPNSEIRDQETTFGVLRLVLDPTSYGWEFLGAGPGSFTDSGSESCVFGAPVVTITSPAPGATFLPGTSVALAASASDLEQGSLSSGLAWSSSRDGALGSGPSLNVTLSNGTHLLTASVTDETGLTGSAQLSVTIGIPPGSGCGLGPELAPVLALLLGRATRQASRATSKRSR